MKCGTELGGGLFLHGDFFSHPSVFILDDLLDLINFVVDDSFQSVEFDGDLFFVQCRWIQHTQKISYRL